MSRISLFAGLTLAISLATASLADEAISPQDVEFFEKNIRPLLAEHCYQCHSKESEELGGELLLDSRAGWMEGGYSGPPIVPGEPDKSLLLSAVKHIDVDLQMPPDRKLPQSAINLLSEWIQRGAPDPRDGEAGAKAAMAGVDLEAGRRHWAFQPPARPTLPSVADAAWPRTPIDRFVLAKLEASGLRPAPPAEARALLRRLYLDLVGFPPTPDDAASFLAAAARDGLDAAAAQWVDKLLASPQYGERWGRHWLDVARYADSNGLDENVAHGNAWQYRDWVVAAFNKDLPYDQFVIQQLAGDLLGAATKEQRNDQLRATGYLTLGAKSLAESDLEKMRMDIIDEQIDTFGRSILGLTLGCARCHDHKFDPIPTSDYYALAGIFRSTRTMETYARIAKWLEHPMPTPEEEAQLAEHQAKVAAKKQEVESFVQAANDKLVADGGAEFQLPENPETAYPDEAKAQLKKLRDELAALEKAPPEVSAAMGVSEDEVHDVAVHIRGSHLRKGEVVPRRFPLALAGQDQPALPKDRSGRMELAQWLTSGKHPLTSRVIVNRVWRWHFGQGIVPSTDNFGLLGDAPANAELLDWLAVEFEESGWSLKRLHRLILQSAAYQQASAAPDSAESAAASVDPENHLLWRFPSRRLEAEAIRDSVLAVSGQIDLRMGGPVLNVKNRAFIFDHTSKDNTTYDPRRRTIYLAVVRNNLCDTFSLFDYPDPAVSSGNRAQTITATQALYMMNSETVFDAAAELARHLLQSESDDRQRVRQLYERALTRPASDEETERTLRFVSTFAAECQRRQADATPERCQELAWQAACQAALASNEFVHIP